MKNKNIWVMIANTEKAYIYSIAYEKTKFKLIKKLTHKESRLKKQDLVSDRPGHYVRSCNKSRGSYAETTDPKLLEIQNFVQQICCFLEKGRTNDLYVGLIIIANPRLYGLVKQSASKPLKKFIKYHIAKDYIGAQKRILQSKWAPDLYHQIRLIFLSSQ